MREGRGVPLVASVLAALADGGVRADFGVVLAGITQTNSKYTIETIIGEDADCSGKQHNNKNDMHEWASCVAVDLMNV